MIEFLKYRKIYFFISGTLVFLSILLLILFGLNFGTDFSGGSSLELNFKENRPEISKIKERLSPFGFKNIIIRPVGDRGIVLIVKEKNIDEKTKEEIVSSLSNLSPLEEKNYNFETVSPLIGKELTRKTIWVIIFCLIFIIIFIGFAFRKVSYPVSSFEYGVAAVLALVHDVLIPLGIFSFLGRFYQVEFNIPIVCALLTIFSYSVFDTVVIYDRIRESFLKRGSKDFLLTINKSLNETLTRSINTSLTTLFVLFSMFFLIGGELKYFSLALIVGMIFGSYSSLFLAPNILVFLYNRKK
jgi:preprotein translocase subunit SecF